MSKIYETYPQSTKSNMKYLIYKKELSPGFELVLLVSEAKTLTITPAKSYRKLRVESSYYTNGPG